MTSSTPSPATSVSDDLELYKSEIWAKYAGAIDYDQSHHRDFGNHTLVVPRSDGRGAQVTTFTLLSEVTIADGPTKVVPLAATTRIPLVSDGATVGGSFTLPFGELNDREVSVTGPAGTLFMYRTDVLHRGSNFTEAGALALLATGGLPGSGYTVVGADGLAPIRRSAHTGSRSWSGQPHENASCSVSPGSETRTGTTRRSPASVADIRRWT